MLSAMPSVGVLSDPATIALGMLLPQIGALHTMAQERDVHGTNVPPSFAVADVVVDEDDADDGLS